MRARSQTFTEPDMESVRKRARILVIDDNDLPAQKLFERDGYHIERWPEIRNLPQLTDGHYDIILLDLQGVGLHESPDKQGLGILSHIKHSNPAQMVIAYSAQTQRLSARSYIDLADAVLDKEASYVDYKELVDSLLRKQSSPGYFVAVMNRELGDKAVLVPKAVPKAMQALGTGRIGAFERYIRANLTDIEQIDRILMIVSIGLHILSLTSGH